MIDPDAFDDDSERMLNSYHDAHTEQLEKIRRLERELTTMTAAKNKALEALKELADRPDCEGPQCFYCDTDTEHPKLGRFVQDGLISELEEVK